MGTGCAGGTKGEWARAYWMGTLDLPLDFLLYLQKGA